MVRELRGEEGREEGRERGKGNKKEQKRKSQRKGGEEEKEVREVEEWKMRRNRHEGDLKRGARRGRRGRKDQEEWMGHRRNPACNPNFMLREHGCLYPQRLADQHAGEGHTGLGPEEQCSSQPLPAGHCEWGSRKFPE